MKALAAVALGCVLATSAFGQRADGFRGRGMGQDGFRVGGFGRAPAVRFGFPHGVFGSQRQPFFNLGLPAVGAIPFLGATTNFSVFDRSFFGPPFVEPFPLFWGYYDTYDYGYAATPWVNVIQQAVPPPKVVVQQPPPREIVRPETREYRAPEAAQAAAPRGEQTAFAIALRNGTTADALAVWAQNGMLHYVDRNNEEHHVPLNAVDRPATQNLNRSRNLNLQLPPG